MTPTERALSYAEQVLDGRILAGKLARLACQRFINDLERAAEGWEYYYDPAAGDRVVNFIEQLPHVKGIWAGRGELLRLEPWQCFAECNIFGWKRCEDDLRRFLESYEEIARKNAKSTRLAGRGLYMFMLDGEFGAEVYAGATTERQAWEVFGPARLMVKNTEDLRERFDVEVNAKNLNVLATNSKFEPLIGKPGDGPSPSCYICDEYHQHDSEAQMEAMQTGMGARQQALTSVITTSGVNLSGPCFEKREEVVRILKGQITDESIFGIIYTLDENDRWDDPANLIKANPNLGVSVDERYLLRQLALARRSARKQNSVRTKNLNQWVGAKVAWMNMLAWQRQRKKGIKIEHFAGRPAYLGIDLASKKDVCAVVALIPDGTDFYVFPFFFAPEKAAEKNEKYREYATGGWLELTEGTATDYSRIETCVKELAQLLNLQAAGFDQWQAQYLAQRLMKKSIPMEEFPHQVRTFSDPMKEIEAQVLAGHLWHDGNPALTWMMGNTMSREDQKRNIYPTKARPDDDKCKIDGVVGLIMAMGLYTRAKEEGDLDDWLDEPLSI